MLTVACNYVNYADKNNSITSVISAFTGLSFCTLVPTPDTYGAHWSKIGTVRNHSEFRVENKTIFWNNSIWSTRMINNNIIPSFSEKTCPTQKPNKQIISLISACFIFYIQRTKIVRGLYDSSRNSIGFGAKTQKRFNEISKYLCFFRDEFTCFFTKHKTRGSFVLRFYAREKMHGLFLTFWKRTYVLTCIRLLHYWVASFFAKQMASQQRQQPFFKTTSNSSTTSGSYFLNYNTNINKNGNQGNQLQQSTSVSRPNTTSVTNFFAPNSTVSRQKDKGITIN